MSDEFLEEEEKSMDEYKFQLRFKQTAKGSFIIDKLEVKGNTAEEVEEGMRKLVSIAVERLKRTYRDPENLALLEEFMK